MKHASRSKRTEFAVSEQDRRRDSFDKFLQTEGNRSARNEKAPPLCDFFFGAVIEGETGGSLAEDCSFDA